VKNQYVTNDAGLRLAARPQPGHPPWVVFLGGFASDMTGTKAEYLAEWCRQREQAFLRFDYTGHGASDGRFEEGSIGQWCADAQAVIEKLTDGPCVLVGSSMGGWIMLHVTLALGARVRGLVGVAAAPDFTRALVSQELTSVEREELQRSGQVLLRSPYDPEGTIISAALIEDGEQQCLLDRPIAIDCPVRLLQGMADSEVPWQIALRLATALAGTDVQVRLIKDGDHRLSAPAQLALLGAALDEVLAGSTTA
tara:strand:+ start:940 stop:1698 length:759 start_codon:yes stop_codon:yes gene_type:complete